MPGSKISNLALKKKKHHNFAIYFIHLELRNKNVRKITGRWEKARHGLDYRIVKITVLSRPVMPLRSLKKRTTVAFARC